MAGRTSSVKTVRHDFSPYCSGFGFGAPLEDVGQGPHQNVIAAIGLKVAVYEGDHFVPLGELEGGVMAVGDIQAYLGIGLEPGGVDAVVNDADPLTKWFGEGAGLPMGGADPSIGKLTVHQVVEVFSLIRQGSSLGAGPGNSGSKPTSALKPSAASFRAASRQACAPITLVSRSATQGWMVWEEPRPGQ